MALEDFEEEDGEGPGGYDYYADLQGVDVALLGCDAEEEDGDAELDEHHVCNVGECGECLILVKMLII